jgi:hypothetical protein
MLNSHYIFLFTKREHTLSILAALTLIIYIYLKIEILKYYYYYYYYYYYCRARNGNIWVKKTYFLVFIHRIDTKASILLFKSCVRVTSNRMTKEFVWVRKSTSVWSILWHYIPTTSSISRIRISAKHIE